jgi:hypothetical protein
VPGDLDGEATGGSTGWSGGGASDGKRLAEDGDEVGKRSGWLLEDDAPKRMGPMPGTV